MLVSRYIKSIELNNIDENQAKVIKEIVVENVGKIRKNGIMKTADKYWKKDGLLEKVISIQIVQTQNKYICQRGRFVNESSKREKRMYLSEILQKAEKYCLQGSVKTSSRL